MIQFQATNYDRMFCYLWWEQSHPGEAKFGERWVKAGEDPVESIKQRVKDSLAVRKDLLKAGEVKIHHWWDVTDLAKKVGRYYKASRMDDYIRPVIGFRKGTTGEVHSLPPDEIKQKVDRYLASIGQPLPKVGLTQWQATAAEDVISAISRNKRYISAELCARFGKTIWAGSLVRELNIPLTVVATYVKTSFASFESDLSGYDQFKDFALVNTDEDDWKQSVDAHLKAKKQVVVFLSLCNGSKRQSRIDYLFNQNVNRLLIVDEADFGAHKPKQALPLVDAMKSNDVVIHMTGTNADRAVGLWPIDHQLSVVYPELVMEKRNPKAAYDTTLKHFKIDPKRHNLVCDVAFYQMNLMSAVEFCRKSEPELFVDSNDSLPQWTKFAANPLKAKGFWNRMLTALFGGENGFDELNADYQFNEVSKNRVSMMFLPGSITNKNLEAACTLAQAALPAFLVVPVYGDVTTNYDCERDVKEAIEKAQKDNKSVLIVSSRMAQRSFSVGAITELYLAYDSGESGATRQKISRALTPSDEGKIGRIVSLSFDPNRDDKFDAEIIETALNFKASRKLASADEAARIVLKTIDLFRCTDDGAIKIDKDDYLEQAIARNSVSRVVGKVADISLLSHDEMLEIANGKISPDRMDKRNAADRGKTYANPKDRSKGQSSKTADDKLIEKVRAAIVGIVENVDYIYYGAGANQTSVVGALKTTIKSKPLHEGFISKFGIEPELVMELFINGVINEDLIELQLNRNVNVTP